MTISSTEPTPELVSSSRLPSEVGSVVTTTPTYTRTISTAIGPSIQSEVTASSAPEEDPVLVWLAGTEARQHETHWVALDPRTGKFLGMADALPSLRMWQARGALVVYVDPPPENWSDE
jgi:hypothetical protein